MNYTPYFKEEYLTWSEKDNLEYDQFKEYIISTNYGTRFYEFGIPSELKDKLSFLKDFAKESGLKIFDLFILFMKKDVFKLFQLIGWSFKELFNLLKKGFQVYNDIQNAISEYLANTRVAKWTAQEIQKLDKFLEKNPKIKAVVGVAVAGLLLYIWFTMSFSGNALDDFDLSLVFLALTSKISLAKIFASPSGIKMLALFATGVLTGLTFPWPGSNLIKFGVAIIMTLGKYFKTKISKGNDLQQLKV